MTIQLKGLEQTRALAQKLTQHLSPGTVVALEGELGAGKTTFVQFCAAFLGIEDSVDSPTFTLLKTYGPPRFHHIDAYRLEGGLSSFDVEDALYDQDAYIFVEWASYIEAALPKSKVRLIFKRISDVEREVTLESEGDLDVKKLLID
jgi:tRNA threonylcarbamoyladenosine biosynthesis protein TsaE